MNRRGNICFSLRQCEVWEFHAPYTAAVTFYDYRLATLSILIAIGASYTALDLAGFLTEAQGRAKWLWCCVGSLALGLGIWSMHYIAMLAFHLPTVIAYDPGLVVVSFLAAVSASAIALATVSGSAMTLRRKVVGALVMY